MLVIAKVALALVLLVGAGLLVRSVEHLFAVSPGFSPTHLLTMQVQTSGHLFDDDASGQGASRRIQFFTQALEKVQRVPGVASAAFTSLLPFSDDPSSTYGASFEVDQPGGAKNVFRYVVSAGYFEAMRIPLRHGRFLDDRDQSGRLPAVVISESLARSAFGKEDPIGKRVHVGPVDRPWFNVVGVVGDVKQTSLAASDPSAVYLTSTQSWFADDAMTLVVRVPGGHPEALAREAQIARGAEVQDRVAEAFAKRCRKTNQGELEAHVLAGLTLSMLSVAYFSWFRHGTQDIGVTAEQVFATLADVVCKPGRGHSAVASPLSKKPASK